MRDYEIHKQLRDMHKTSKEYLKTASKKERFIYKITLTMFLLEFAAIGAGILIAGILHNFICLAITATIFLLTVIIGANAKSLKCLLIKIDINCNKNRTKEFAIIKDEKIIAGSIVNGDLAKVIMEFAFEVDGIIYTGYKILKIKKLKRGKDFKTDATFDERLTKFTDFLNKNDTRLNIKYIPNKKYCVITDNADFVFNYFIIKILTENDDNN